MRETVNAESAAGAEGGWRLNDSGQVGGVRRATRLERDRSGVPGRFVFLIGALKSLSRLVWHEVCHPADPWGLGPGDAPVYHHEATPAHCFNLIKGFDRDDPKYGLLFEKEDHSYNSVHRKITAENRRWFDNFKKVLFAHPTRQIEQLAKKDIECEFTTFAGEHI